MFAACFLKVLKLCCHVPLCARIRNCPKNAALGWLAIWGYSLLCARPGTQTQIKMLRCRSLIPQSKNLGRSLLIQRSISTTARHATLPRCEYKTQSIMRQRGPLIPIRSFTCSLPQMHSEAAKESPADVVVKPATVENGLAISDRAVKVYAYTYEANCSQTHIHCGTAIEIYP